MFTSLNPPGIISPESLLRWAEENFRQLETVLNGLGHIQVFTPVFAATGGGALGNGSLTGWFVELGPFNWVTIDFTLGSTTNPGTGIWTFSVPNGILNTSKGAGSAVFTDSSANIRYTGSCVVGSTVLVCAAAVGDVAFSNPFVWAVGDRIQASHCWPIARV